MPKATFVDATLAELVTTAYVTGVLEPSLLSPGPRFYGQPASSLLTLEICSGSGRLSVGLKQLGVQRFGIDRFREQHAAPFISLDLSAAAGQAL